MAEMIPTGRCIAKSYVPNHLRLPRLTFTFQGNDEESDAEDDDLTQLQSIENRLLQHDSTFSEDDTMGGRVQVKHALINAFVRGGSTERFDADNLEHTHQLHLNVERIRVPETWFQPSMFGLDCAGLGEVAGWVLNSFEERERRRMMQVSSIGQ